MSLTLTNRLQVICVGMSLVLDSLHHLIRNVTLGLAYGLTAKPPCLGTLLTSLSIVVPHLAFIAYPPTYQTTFTV